MVKQDKQRLPVAVRRDDARHIQQQTPQEDKNPFQNGKPQHPEKDAEPIQNVAVVRLFPAADMQRVNGKPHADHIVHDRQRRRQKHGDPTGPIVVQKMLIGLQERFFVCILRHIEDLHKRVHTEHASCQHRQHPGDQKHDQAHYDGVRAVPAQSLTCIRLEYCAVDSH